MKNLQKKAAFFAVFAFVCIFCFSDFFVGGSCAGLLCFHQTNGSCILHIFWTKILQAIVLLMPPRVLGPEKLGHWLATGGPVAMARHQPVAPRRPSGPGTAPHGAPLARAPARRGRGPARVEALPCAACSGRSAVGHAAATAQFWQNEVVVLPTPNKIAGFAEGVGRWTSSTDLTSGHLDSVSLPCCSELRNKEKVPIATFATCNADGHVLSRIYVLITGCFGFWL